MKTLASPLRGHDRLLRDIPEIRIVSLGFGLSLVWEILQSPFYADTYEVSWATLAYYRLHCTGGDVLILLTTFWIVALIWGRSWMRVAGWAPVVLFAALGVVYTAFSEYFNVRLVQSWAYSRWMPTLAGIGLIPLLQWVAIPTVIVLYARKRIGSAGFLLRRPQE
ncbi:MAG: hypothetical protein ACE5I2_13870 [Anaerolineae bacterium]